MVDGRFEKVDCGQAFNVIVDYAHVPESLESLLNMYKKLTQGELYGCIWCYWRWS